MTDVQAILSRDAACIDSWLSSYFDKCEATATDPHLLKAMRYSALNGGKRLRGSLVLSAARMAENISMQTEACSNPVAVAASVELMHSYSLIHDDLPAMDNSDYRRGKKSTHKKFDEATAILAGDALQSWGFELISNPRNFKHRDKMSQLVFELSKAIGFCGMVGGQQGDIDFTHNDLSEDNILWIQQKKTGSLLECCGTLSSMICNAKDDQIK